VLFLQELVQQEQPDVQEQQDVLGQQGQQDVQEQQELPGAQERQREPALLFSVREAAPC
jgi:hypothetical protein